MEGTNFNSDDVIRSVKILVNNILSGVKKFQCLGEHDWMVMERLGCSIIPIVKRRLKLIAWTPPERGRVKLNVDGSSRGNPSESGGGGIIRDSRGNVMAGAHYYGQATNTIAECRALLDGLWMCRQLGSRDILVESDSKVIVGWLALGVCKYWFLWDYWEEVKEIVGELNIRFRHIFREANMVVDYLAKQGSYGINYDEVPLYVRGLIRMDKLGIPYIRR